MADIFHSPNPANALRVCSGRFEMKKKKERESWLSALGSRVFYSEIQGQWMEELDRGADDCNTRRSLVQRKG